MNSLWEPVVEPLLRAVAPSQIVEVGVGGGFTTVRLLQFAEETGCTIHAIDPDPKPPFDADALREEHGARFVFHQGASLEILPQLGDIDAALIDGDHNWFTVYHELKAIEEHAEAGGRDVPLTMLHDVDWPYGRRDCYYAPERIPAEHLQPNRMAGILPGRNELVDNGGVNQRVHNATSEGTPHNGVRSAVEDFLAEAKRPYVLRFVAGFHGLGILVSASRLEKNDELRGRLDELDSAAWLKAHVARLEEARLRLQVQLASIRQNRATAPEGDTQAR
jgi:hypothetical protein